MFQFFTGEMTIDLFHLQFRELFLTKRQIEFNAVGVDYDVGDVLLFTKHGELSKYGALVVKKATVDVLKEETKLVCYTVRGKYE